MKTKFRHDLHAIVLVAGLLCGGCGNGSQTTSAVAAAPPSTRTNTASDASIPAAQPSTPKPRATNRPANLKGKVFVVEYHHILPKKGDMFRSPEEFRKDLERLYKDGFRPCTVSQYLDDKMDMPPGATPAVFTFDDSNASQIKLLPDGTVDPQCAVGIWMAFAKEHPDFPVRATFFVLPDVMWGQPKMLDKKLALLKSLGCELQSHTVSHPILRKLSDEKVKKEFGDAIEDLVKLGVPQPVSLALPFGVSPKNKALLRSFDYNGKHYTMRAAFLVGAEPSPAPTDPKLDLYRIPRIQAYNGICSLNEWLDKAEKDQVKLYVAP